MNTSHFPDLERCKKLTEVGFTVCELAWCNMAFRKSDEPDIKIYGGLGSPRRIDWTIAQCPSVSELLDEMPHEINLGDINGHLRLGPDFVAYHKPGENIYKGVIKMGTIPNALADMYIWLKKNNYLPK